MKLTRQIASAALAIAALGAAGVAQARDVYWSIGIDAAPGVTLGVGNTRPVVVAPAPVYMAARPVYVAPRPVIVHPAPVYYAAPVYYYDAHPGKGHRKHHRHHRHHRHWD